MGETKKWRQRFFGLHPLCCYCGGDTMATTIDHVPAKIMFWGKRRPQGLEMPACDCCNGGTKKLERAAAVFAHIRMADNRSPKQRTEHRSIGHGVGVDFPGWQHEWQAVPDHPDAARLPPGVTPVNVGPLMRDAINIVGAKLAFALHYKHTSMIIPASGFVSVSFETNVTWPQRQIPDEILAALAPTGFLRQGEWTSEGHFAYRGAWTADGAGSVFIAHIGEAFFLKLHAEVASPQEADVDMENPSIRIFRPKELQQADRLVAARYKVVLPVDRIGGPVDASWGLSPARMGYDISQSPESSAPAPGTDKVLRS